MPYPETTHPPPAAPSPSFRPLRLHAARVWPFPAGATVLGLSDVMIQARRIIATSTHFYLSRGEH